MALESAACSTSIVATFPPGFFLENIATLPDDTLLVTVANRKSLYAIPPPAREGDARPAYLLEQFKEDQWAFGITAVPNKPGLAFVATTDFTSQGSRTHHLQVLDVLNVAQAGHLTNLVQFPPGAKGLNGLLALNDNVLLVADSFAGCIWRVDVNYDSQEKPANATVTKWMKDPLFDGLLVLPDFQPGVNGLGYSPSLNALCFSNTQKRLFGKIPVDPDTLQPSGPTVILAKEMQGDDMIIDEHYSGGPVAYLTTHRENTLLRIPIAAEGSNGTSDVLAEPEVVLRGTEDQPFLVGPSAGEWRTDAYGKTAYITCDGGLKNPLGGGAPRYARILQVDL